MSFMDIAGSSLLYMGVFGGLAVVVFFCALFYIKTRKRALELGVSKESLNRVVKSTLLFTIVPSLAIAVGLFALVGVVGMPWATFRLSIIGSLNYELNSANIAAGVLGFGNITEALDMGAHVFGAIMMIMSLGIFLPPVINAIVTKPLAKTLQTDENSNQKRFIPIMNACFMIALLCLYIPTYLFAGWTTILVVVVSLLVSVLMEKIAAKVEKGWIHEFAMPISLLAGMASSILWVNMLG